MDFLFHGTTALNAKKIIKSGFKRGITPTYCGTGICLTPVLSMAYEYGPVHSGGRILKVRLSSNAVVHDLGSSWRIDDTYFHNNRGVDAAIISYGNVVVVYNPSAIETVELVPPKDTLRLLHDSFKEEYPDLAYNGACLDAYEAWCDTNGLEY